ncbi:uncharacterized protein [Aegilops tauschii subsp. strangulata]|uniref:uncharacterized protein n=1 Tax=Aegilops tauschii subsp. strangulata TaxID=200361 RepID=UPI00098A46E6|nr:uncharacterized protein LOC109776303 [Aegilops tauschii subsp. strangulata]
MEIVFKLHGPPDKMVSDQDRIFPSRVWQELAKLTRTTLNISSARHPQTDGTTKRVNQCMELYLRCFVHNCPSKWADWLALTEFWYNTSYHSVLKSSAFEVLYGHKPRFFGITNIADDTVSDLAAWTKDRATVLPSLKQHLHRARQVMKAKRTIPSVTRRVGEVVYRLALPEHAKIHPVIHVSQLHAGVPPDTQIMPELPVLDEDVLPFQVPATILQRRDVQRESGKYRKCWFIGLDFLGRWPPGKMKCLSTPGFLEPWLGDKPKCKGGGMSQELLKAKAQHRQTGPRGPTSDWASVEQVRLLKARQETS